MYIAQTRDPRAPVRFETCAPMRLDHPCTMYGVLRTPYRVVTLTNIHVRYTLHIPTIIESTPDLVYNY